MPSQSWIHVLWAESERYKTPNVVIAYGTGLREGLREEFDVRIEAAKQWFLEFGDESDGPWTFWVTTETIPVAEKPAEVSEDA